MIFVVQSTIRILSPTRPVHTDSYKFMVMQPLFGPVTRELRMVFLWAEFFTNLKTVCHSIIVNNVPSFVHTTNILIDDEPKIFWCPSRLVWVVHFDFATLLEDVWNYERNGVLFAIH